MRDDALEVRKTADRYWQVVHLPTGKTIAPTDKEVRVRYGKNKRLEVVAFYERIKDAFPWHEWKDATVRPDWADEAFDFIHFYRKG